MKDVLQKDRKLYLPATDARFAGFTRKINGKSYREWEATRSKLAAAMLKGAKGIEIKSESKILYLGAAHGYTCSFLSQMADKGKIFAVEFAPRVARELIIMAAKRKNMLPIVADANQPQKYYHLAAAADILYQDIAQRNQVEILVKNSSMFLKREGIAMIAIKARSIDVTQQPGKIFADVKKQLEQHFKVIDYRNLAPMQKDHAFFVCRKR